MQTYTGKIRELGPNSIFVFGSNTQGRHGKGAALLARNKFGAIYGKASGLQGQSFAIVTKDMTKSKHPSIDKENIIAQIYKLYIKAVGNSEKKYYVAYSGTGSNLNGYTPKEMAYMFAVYAIPSNIVFEEEFAKLIQAEQKENEGLHSMMQGKDH